MPTTKPAKPVLPTVPARIDHRSIKNAKQLQAHLRSGLEERGLRVTQQRLVIYRFLYESFAKDKHPTAEEIYRAIKPDMPSISLATVYKALETLADVGLVTKLKLGGESAHFDFRTDPHHHTYCLDSGTLTDVEVTDPIRLNELLDIPSDFGAESVRINITGWCGDCHDHHDGEGEERAGEVDGDGTPYGSRDQASTGAKELPIERGELICPLILRQALEDTGRRMTQQRNKVYSFLHRAQETGVHPTAEVVYQGVRGDMPTISLATVYKALDALVDCGLAQKLIIADSSAYYDVRIDPHHHAHCRECQQLFDVESPSDPSLLLETLEVEKGFVIEQVLVSIEGVCASCSGQHNPTKN